MMNTHKDILVRKLSQIIPTNITVSGAMESFDFWASNHLISGHPPLLQPWKNALDACQIMPNMEKRPFCHMRIAKVQMRVHI